MRFFPLQFITLGLFCTLNLFGCTAKQPSTKQEKTPIPTHSVGTVLTETGERQEIAHLLPQGALLFLCTCAQCRTTIASLELILKKQPNLRPSLAGLTSMNSADNHQFRLETHASFPLYTDVLNGIGERYGVSQCPRLICLSKTGGVVFDSGQTSKPIPSTTLQKGLGVIQELGGERG